MKRLYAIIALCLLLCSCGVKADEQFFVEGEDRLFYVYRIKQDSESVAEEEKERRFMNAMWVSQFDMHPIYRENGKQRDESDYRIRVSLMVDNLLRDGFDTVFLQVRPNGDSMFESEFFPNSKYIAGTYGGECVYDAIGIYLEIAKNKGLSVHAWINPYRLCYEEELIAYGEGLLYEWHSEGLGKRIEKGGDGLLYLDPSYEEAAELIANGAKEIFEKYGFDGLHIDDYFYPTEFEFDDTDEFAASGYGDLGDFRRANVDRTVKALYDIAHSYGKIFGVSPAGNIYSLENGWFIDIYKWLSEDGYLDYVMPQLYYGFNNAVCPFERVLGDWSQAVKNERTELYIGLSAAKCALGSEGIEDVFAGSEGKYEWRDENDILMRSYKASVEIGADGICIFSYSSFYVSLSGESNPLTNEERENLLKILEKKTE